MISKCVLNSDKFIPKPKSQLKPKRKGTRSISTTSTSTTNFSKITKSQKIFPKNISIHSLLLKTTIKAPKRSSYYRLIPISYRTSSGKPSLTTTTTTTHSLTTTTHHHHHPYHYHNLINNIAEKQVISQLNNFC